jgi:hypothetical protein
MGDESPLARAGDDCEPFNPRNGMSQGTVPCVSRDLIRQQLRLARSIGHKLLGPNRLHGLAWLGLALVAQRCHERKHSSESCEKLI